MVRPFPRGNPGAATEASKNPEIFKVWLVEPIGIEPTTS